MKKMIPALIGLVLLTCTGTAMARVYAVEVLVFKQNNPGSGVAPLTIDANLTQDVDTSHRQLSPYDGGTLNAYEQFPSSRMVLNAVANRLQSNGYEVLYHTAWYQGVNRRGTPLVDIIDDSGRVSGSVSTSESRYYHFAPNLIITDDNGDRYQLKDNRRIELNKINYFDNARYGVMMYLRR